MDPKVDVTLMKTKKKLKTSRIHPLKDDAINNSSRFR